MIKVKIYTKDFCPYCTKAKALFNKKNIPFEEIDITGNNSLLEQMIQQSNGMKTVPQIFINDQHIGGCDDLYKLYESGKLEL
ncbi:glutaredoxin 3 [Ehrlichia chaffeensis str. Arkansas]|uniref:Glutaredoxin n=1 Tax=Ehrlichia chaffeensis (strain ATCC CRL-10679 / Arkansas) TaxID=205920 RepID=Q2GFD6_EHRCR|nr:glutaredoxin 3 [Ehrlichia chaffeensis]ABD44975.1 glutaredoxin 3 [Ehrlichia chaffeensis str. Arkansas]AHX05203.1 glutaredoxin 3 [Ehrlichia chaffeensis str. Jax]AHX09011.1 glutaredoxin 3 [Ehrlichia chaffeensis str. Saint Vincent]AHX09122.1 glutaredoxin 3 [Ehrlichia chaffeensis str. Wakulla]AHX10584.1 glutaredoxin 3 [Ehrlichia chaffeensis str. West Paces]